MFAAYCQEYPEMEALWDKYHSGVGCGFSYEQMKNYWAVAGQAGGHQNLVRKDDQIF